MYAPLIEKSGVELVNEWMGRLVTAGPDGLEVTTGEITFGKTAALPVRLEQLLVDFRLLRRIPLSYLVPDAALLPPESIRSFHVDLTWIDRVIDGVFAAANTGSTDLAYNCGLLALARTTVDGLLVKLANDLPTGVPGTSWTPAKHPITGMLIRSELTRRWPDMIVQAFAKGDASDPVPVLRSEAISRDIYISLFAGRPRVVHIREPHVGQRFGVEPKNPAKSEPPYQVDRRSSTGAPWGAPVPIALRHEAERVLDVADLGARVGFGGTSRMVAIHLEQKPYVQEFKDSCPEMRGSVPTPRKKVPLRRGRFIDVTPLHARLAQRGELETI